MRKLLAHDFSWKVGQIIEWQDIVGNRNRPEAQDDRSVDQEIVTLMATHRLNLIHSRIGLHWLAPLRPRPDEGTSYVFSG
jgi:hypothetical protein